MADLAIVICAHHKPWLGMATALTLAAQDADGYELHVCYNVGDGTKARGPGHAEYERLAAQWGINTQLSPFDERVRHVFSRRDVPVFEHEFQNDQTLDSGCWYKFLRTGAWRSYDHVLFLGEGTIFTRTSSLGAMLAFARRRDAHFIAGGHEKRRLPRDLFLHYNARGASASPMAQFHDRMIQQTFDVFRRDPTFDRAYAAWTSDAPGQTQDHVPDIWPRTAFGRRVAHRAGQRTPDATARALRRCLSTSYRLRSRVAMWGLGGRQEVARPRIHVDSELVPLEGVVTTETEGPVRFHRESDPAWFGCATNHLMSRRFLTDLVDRLDRHAVWDALDVPFAGTALEPVWGMMPAWLGYEKWFTDALHRPRKDFVTYRREDDPQGMADYINRYFRGDLVVQAQGEYLRVKATSRAQRRLRQRLPLHFFGAAPEAATGIRDATSTARAA